MTSQPPTTSPLLFNQKEKARWKALEDSIATMFDGTVDLTERSLDTNLPFNNRLNSDGDLVED